MKNKHEVPTYIKRLFSDVEMGESNDSDVTIIKAENVDSDDITNIIEEATDEVEASTGSREFANLFKDKFTKRLFSAAVEADEKGGDEVDVDAEAEAALEEASQEMKNKEEKEETKTQSFAKLASKYFTKTKVQSEYDKGYLDAMKLFSDLAEGSEFAEDEKSTYEGDVIDQEELTADEKVVAQSALACAFSQVFTRVFAEAKAEGASDVEATAEAAEEASIATGVAEPSNEDEDTATKVQSFVESNKYYSAFIRTFSEAKEGGASDTEAVIEAVTEVMDEAGIKSEVQEDVKEAIEEVKEEEVKEETKVETKKQSVPEFQGTEVDDENKDQVEITGSEALEDVQDFEDEGEKRLYSQVMNLLDQPSFDTNTDLTKSVENLL